MTTDFSWVKVYTRLWFLSLKIWFTWLTQRKKTPSTQVLMGNTTIVKFLMLRTKSKIKTKTMKSRKKNGVMTKMSRMVMIMGQSLKRWSMILLIKSLKSSAKKTILLLSPTASWSHLPPPLWMMAFKTPLMKIWTLQSKLLYPPSKTLATKHPTLKLQAKSKFIRRYLPTTIPTYKTINQ